MCPSKTTRRDLVRATLSGRVPEMRAAKSYLVLPMYVVGSQLVTYEEKDRW